MQRVLLLGNAIKGPQVATEFWYQRGFRECGWEPHLVDIRRPEEMVVEAVRKHGKQDYILYFAAGRMTPTLIQATRGQGKLTGLITFDWLAWGGPQKVKRFLDCCPLVDLVFHTGGAPECERAVFLPQACEPLDGPDGMLLFPACPQRSGKAVFVAGALDPERRKFMELVGKHDVEIVGGVAPKGVWRQRLFDLCASRPVMVTDIRSAKGRPPPPRYRSSRQMILAGYAACVLHPRYEGCEQDFVPGGEMVYYSDYEDMLRKLEQLRSDPALCTQIGDAAYSRARRDHTYANRGADMLRFVEVLLG